MHRFIGCTNAYGGDSPALASQDEAREDFLDRVHAECEAVSDLMVHFAVRGPSVLAARHSRRWATGNPIAAGCQTYMAEKANRVRSR